MEGASFKIRLNREPGKGGTPNLIPLLLGNGCGRNRRPCRILHEEQLIDLEAAAAVTAEFQMLLRFPSGHKMEGLVHRTEIFPLKPMGELFYPVSGMQVQKIIVSGAGFSAPSRNAYIISRVRLPCGSPSQSVRGSSPPGCFAGMT